MSIDYICDMSRQRNVYVEGCMRVNNLSVKYTILLLVCVCVRTPTCDVYLNQGENKKLITSNFLIVIFGV